MSYRLSDPQAFLAEGSALSKRAHLGMAEGKLGMGLYGGQEDRPEALAVLRPVKRRDSLPERVGRLLIAAQGLVGHAEILIG